MTRAVIGGGTRAIVQELARSLTSNVLILDATGEVVVECHPRSFDVALFDQLTIW